jgi:hypothetical protein
LREGGSLPAIVEADDDGIYVLKFRGAGQGRRALVAELVSGEIGRALGLPVPELVFADLHPDLARTEPDPEISALIRASGGLNLAMDYLPGAMTFDPLVDHADPGLASRILWFDAFVTNVDRTARNTNMLMWHRRLWLIDHGATLYAHHSVGWQEGGSARDAFPLIKNHVLLRQATDLAAADTELAARLAPAVVGGIVELIPAVWLNESGSDDTVANQDHYARYLNTRLAGSRTFVEEALRVR